MVASLQEISLGYFDASVLLRAGIQELKERMKTMDDVDKASANAILRIYRQSLKETRDLRNLCRDYYTRPRSSLYTMSQCKGYMRDALK